MTSLNNSLFKALVIRIIILLRWGIYFVIAGVFFVCSPLVRHYIFRQSWEKKWPDWVRYSQGAFWIHGIKLQIFNPFKISLQDNYIIIANHRSWFDQLAITLTIPKPLHVLAKAGYFNYPFLGWALYANGSICVKEKKLQGKDLTKWKLAIQHRESILIYPEGTRGEGRQLLPFRSGYAKASLESGLSILPIYLLGSEERLSKKNSLLSVTPGNILCICGKLEKFSANNLETDKTEFEKRYRKNYETLYDFYLKKELHAEQIEKIFQENA